jgi:hypothetical protein
MGHATLTALLVTSFGGYTMIYSGLAKRMLRTGTRGRCRKCGRTRDVCTCGGRRYELPARRRH